MRSRNLHKLHIYDLYRKQLFYFIIKYVLLSRIIYYFIYSKIYKGNIRESSFNITKPFFIFNSFSFSYKMIHIENALNVNKYTNVK